MIFLFLFLALFPVKSDYLAKTEIKEVAFFNWESFISEDNNLNLLRLNPEEISAEAILVKEFYGKTLLRKNAYQPRPIASLTKLMSAHLAYLVYKPEDKFIFDRESLSPEGEVGNFYPGEVVTRDNALKASLVASSNDAIFLLAKNYGLEKFIQLMNEKAKEIGMRKTQFIDPTGLQSNLSSPFDLYLLSEKILSQTPEIFSWTTLEKVNINNKVLWTTNILLPKYKNITVGAKTGFTEDAGECLLMVFKFEKSPFLSIVILNSQDRFKDAEKIIKALEDYYGS